MLSVEEMCFESQKIENEFQISNKSIFIYTGNDLESDNVEKVFLENLPQSKKWIKEDGKWGINFLPKTDLLVYTVKDTLISSEFEVFKYTTFEPKPLAADLSIDVLCPNELTTEFFEYLQIHLLQEGYFIGIDGISGVFNTNTKCALIKFQQKNFLPTGHLDKRTLQFLLPQKDSNNCYAKYAVSSNNLHNNYLYGTARITQINPKSTKWVKKLADKNCLSDDPDDCMVWCLIEVPKDTVYVNNVEIIDLSDFYTYSEIICPEKITEELLVLIYEVLYNEYYVDRLSKKKRGNWDYLEEGFENYQSDYDLPVGPINEETLKHMKLMD